MVRSVNRALLGRDVAPLRRTRIGFLDLPKLQNLTDFMEKGAEGTKRKLEPKTLRPEQFAFLHRLGLRSPLRNLQGTVGRSADLESQWVRCFYPDGYKITAADQTLHDSGDRALRFFTRELIAAKWPRLPNPTVSRVMDTFISNPAIAALGRNHGIEDCVVNVIGLREPLVLSDMPSLAERVRFLTFPQISRNAKRFAKTDEGILRQAELKGRVKADEQVKDDLQTVHAWSMRSVLGVMRRAFGARCLRSFLDARLFSAEVDLKELYMSEYPLVELTEHIRQSTGNQSLNVEFRMLKESGRVSASSMFLIGVYREGSNGEDKLGEGYGPSILLAQQRACIDALRKLHLVTLYDYERPSDRLNDSQLDALIDKVKA